MVHARAPRTGSDTRLRNLFDSKGWDVNTAVIEISRGNKSQRLTDRQRPILDDYFGADAVANAEEAAAPTILHMNFATARAHNVDIVEGEQIYLVTKNHGKTQEHVRDVKTGRFVKVRRITK